MLNFNFSKFKIKAHVLQFGLLCGIPTGIAILYSRSYSLSEEQKHQQILEKFPEIVQKNQKQQKEMQEFFTNMKNSSGQSNSKFDGKY